MIEFEATFECSTRQDAVWALQEIIGQIEGDYHCGSLSCADGSWSCVGEDEPDDLGLETDDDEDEDGVLFCPYCDDTYIIESKNGLHRCLGCGNEF
jgi:hypothetical protein